MPEILIIKAVSKATPKAGVYFLSNPKSSQNSASKTLIKIIIMLVIRSFTVFNFMVVASFYSFELRYHKVKSFPDIFSEH